MTRTILNTTFAIAALTAAALHANVATADTNSLFNSIASGIGTAVGTAAGVAAEGIGDAVNIGLGGVDAENVTVITKIKGDVTNEASDDANVATRIGTVRGVKGKNIYLDVNIEGNVLNSAKGRATSTLAIGTIGR